MRFWTFDKASLETTLMTPRLKLANPLLAAMADGRGGELSVEKTGLSVSRPSILLTAFAQIPMVAAHCCGFGNGEANRVYAT